jgi:DnaJ-class molecular chaperone
MDRAEAMKILSRPLKFGDSEQIAAHQFLESLCDRCDGEGQTLYFGMPERCQQCKGSGKQPPIE